MTKGLEDFQGFHMQQSALAEILQMAQVTLSMAMMSMIIILEYTLSRNENTQDSQPLHIMQQ